MHFLKNVSMNCPSVVPEGGPPPLAAILLSEGRLRTEALVVLALSSIALFSTTQNRLPFVRGREKGKGRREKKGRKGKG